MRSLLKHLFVFLLPSLLAMAQGDYDNSACWQGRRFLISPRQEYGHTFLILDADRKSYEKIELPAPLSDDGWGRATLIRDCVVMVGRDQTRPVVARWDLKAKRWLTPGRVDESFPFKVWQLLPLDDNRFLALPLLKINPDVLEQAEAAHPKPRLASIDEKGILWAEGEVDLQVPSRYWPELLYNPRLVRLGDQSLVVSMEVGLGWQFDAEGRMKRVIHLDDAMDPLPQPFRAHVPRLIALRPMADGSLVVIRRKPSAALERIRLAWRKAHLELMKLRGKAARPVLIEIALLRKAMGDEILELEYLRYDPETGALRPIEAPSGAQVVLGDDKETERILDPLFDAEGRTFYHNGSVEQILQAFRIEPRVSPTQTKEAKEKSAAAK